MSLGRNAIYNLVGQAAPIAVALVTIPIYLHLVGAERYGVLAICWMLLGYFGLFDLGLTRATAHRIAAQRDGTAAARARTFWTSAVVSLGLAVVGAALLYAGGRWYFTGPFEVSGTLRREALEALPILALALPGAILGGVFNGSLQGRERFLAVNAVGIVQGCATQVVPVLIAWLAGPRLALLLIGSVSVQLASLVVLFALCRRHVIAGQGFAPSRTDARALLRYGGWISVPAALAPLMVVIDRFVIGALLNATAVATYSVPAQLAQRVSLIPYALANALFPRLSADQDAARGIALARLSTRAAMAVMSPAVMVGICGMGPFLTLWLRGALPAEAVTVGQIAMLGWWVNGLAINPFSLLQASGRPRLPALMHIIELPVYAALLWGLTLRFGLTGAASAFAVRCALDCVALCAIAYRGQTDLAVYAFPGVMLIAAIPLIGNLTLAPLPLAGAGALVAAVLGWSALVLPPHLRQWLLDLINYRRWTRYAQPRS